MTFSIESVSPPRAVEGGRVTLQGTGFPAGLTTLSLGDATARVAFATSRRLVFNVPGELEGGRVPIGISEGAAAGFLSIGATWATGLHQVDSPVFDAHGNLFVTYSGSRGQEAPISIFRVTSSGTREPFASGIVNATSMIFAPDGRLYVSSRFEGAVYAVDADGGSEQVATDLGVACGLAFDEEGWLYVGDRSGTIFRVRDGKAIAHATLPPSVAAFHLAMSPAGELYVTAPTLNSYDFVYRVDRHGSVHRLPAPLGRPQGLAFSPDGALHVVDALAGASGVYRFASDTAVPELIVSGTSLIGVAFGPSGELVVSSNETVYRFD